MSVKQITTDDLRKMKGTEGLIPQGCGGSLDEWIDGINDLLTESEILLNGTKFKAENCCVFENEGLTNLMVPFSEDVKLDMGKLAMWRLQTHEMCDRICASGSYDEALCIIGDYVNITGEDDYDEDMDDGMEFGGM